MIMVPSRPMVFLPSALPLSPFTSLSISPFLSLCLSLSLYVTPFVFQIFFKLTSPIRLKPYICPLPLRSLIPFPPPPFPHFSLSPLSLTPYPFLNYCRYVRTA